MNGRGGEIRTPDPLLPKQMRYQAALRPDTSILSHSPLVLHADIYTESTQDRRTQPDQQHKRNQCQSHQTQP